MSALKVGVVGAGRGAGVGRLFDMHPDAAVTALCDRAVERHDRAREMLPHLDLVTTEFDELLDAGIQAVYIANYPTDHVPLALKALEAGIHVLSEVVACKTLAEGVALARAVEKAKVMYAFAENCCYYRPIQEMKRLFDDGSLGEFIYGECEYVHDTTSVSPHLTYTAPEHPTNWMPATIYCSHSLGPILHATGARPVRCTGFTTVNRLNRLAGRHGDDIGILICQMDNGAVVKALKGSGVRREPIMHWYSVYGTKGQAENRRSPNEEWLHLYLEHPPDGEPRKEYVPDWPYELEWGPSSGYHGGIDAYTVHEFVRAVLDGAPPPIDVYAALDMTLPGILAFRSAVDGNTPQEVPDFRYEDVRARYESDDWCPSPADPGPNRAASASAHGRVDIPPEVYERQRDITSRAHSH